MQYVAHADEGSGVGDMAWFVLGCQFIKGIQKLGERLRQRVGYLRHSLEEEMHELAYPLGMVLMLSLHGLYIPQRNICTMQIYHTRSQPVNTGLFVTFSDSMKHYKAPLSLAL